MKFKIIASVVMLVILILLYVLFSGTPAGVEEIVQ